MNIRGLKVIKKPRDDPIPDIPINFPPFQNLRLDLLEIKEKLKKGLPLIPKTKIFPKPIPPTPPKETPAIQKDPVKTTDKLDKNIEKPVEKDHVNVIEIPTKKSPKEVTKKKKVVVSSESSIAKDLGTSSDSEGEKVSLVNSSEESIRKEGDHAKSTGEEAPAQEAPKEEEYDIYAGLSPEEREKKEKEEYLWRFRILKKQYGRTGSIPIPEWNEFSDITMMKTSYERTLRELYLDNAVEDYKTYLIGGWMLMEYVCTTMMEINLTGFTMRQMKLMYKYERYLIELGEKSYTQWQFNFPVELRLAGMILFQAAIFYLGKVLHQKFGDHVGGLFEDITGQPPMHRYGPQDRPQNEEEDDVVNVPPQKKMRGPKIKASDIRNRAGQQ